jgi:hypothetical protein
MLPGCEMGYSLLKPVKNASGLWDGSFLVESVTDDQSKKLLDSYPVG